MATFKDSVLQVVRLVDQYCIYNGFNWSLYGAFLRKMFSSLDASAMEECPIEFHITSQRNDHILILAKNMEITGFVVKYKTTFQAELRSPTHPDMVIYLNADFPVTQFAEDTLILTQTGICNKTTIDTFDTLNITKGIGTLERILNLKENMLTSHSYFLASNAVPSHRFHNMELLKGESDAKEQGFETRGANLNIFKMQDGCPICYEEGTFGTRLKCGHTFCLKCLSHVLSMEEQHLPRCSLCRKALMFIL